MNKRDIGRLLCVMVMALASMGVPLGVMMGPSGGSRVYTVLRSSCVTEDLTGGEKGNLVTRQDC